MSFLSLGWPPVGFRAPYTSPQLSMVSRPFLACPCLAAVPQYQTLCPFLRSSPWMGEALFRNSLVATASRAYIILQCCLRVSLSSILCALSCGAAADGGGGCLQSACDFGVPALVPLHGLMQSCESCSNSSVVALAVYLVLPILGTVGRSWFAWVNLPTRRSLTLPVFYPSTTSGYPSLYYVI